MQMQPLMPALQQPPPLRPPPSTPSAVACEVHNKILDMVELAEARTAKIDFLLRQDASVVSHDLGVSCNCQTFRVPSGEASASSSLELNVAAPCSVIE